MRVAYDKQPPQMRRLLYAPVVMALLALQVHLVLQVHAQGTRARVDVSRLGPQVGERVPEFQLIDQAGKAQTLQSIMGRRGAMLVFVRSADW
jgi:hypothetical protein